MADRYPLTEPYGDGMLGGGDGTATYWSVSGNPDGVPALIVHGGPGSGSSPGARTVFDPQRYRIIQFDQRGCGRSTPHASDPATDMSVNTTAHLIADMERLRAHLGVERWLLHGGSWGSTLILAYALAHPDRVSAIVIQSVTTTRRSEIGWLYRGVARFFPAESERFRAAVPARDGEDVLAAYARQMADPDPAVRVAAAAEWCAWEDTVLSTEAYGHPAPYSSRVGAAREAFVRICAHYFSNGAWLDEGVLIRDAGRLAGIPGVLVHGRFDLGGPLDTAWELHHAWPGSRLVICDDSGHKGSPSMSGATIAAIDGFADGTRR